MSEDIKIYIRLLNVQIKIYKKCIGQVWLAWLKGRN